MGIHTGDVIMDEEIIYGDGVNTASRVESRAVPGSVLVSGKVFDEIGSDDMLLRHPPRKACRIFPAWRNVFL